MEPWHERFVRLRTGKGWSLKEAATAFVAASEMHTANQLETVRRSIIRWERGEIADPTPETKRAIASMFDLPVADFFPERPLRDHAVPERLAPDEFNELVAALRMARVGSAHLDQAEAQVERLCSTYAVQDAAVLTGEVDDWIRTCAELVNEGRVNLDGHRRVLRLAGWLSLLRACLTWDQGDQLGSEHARVAAEGFATDLDDAVMHAWTWELRAWIALTQGDMPQVVAAADAGIRRSPHAPVAAQLHAQKAKAYARMRDQHKTVVALEGVRLVLDEAPTPDNLRNHFSVDPTKASFYAMDAYRVLGLHRMADALADTVIATSVRPDGTPIAPMRLSEALLTKAVVLASSGSVPEAVRMAEQALSPDRRSEPQLLLVADEVTRALAATAPSESSSFARHVRELTALG